MPASRAAQGNAYRNRLAFKIGYMGARYMTPVQIAAALDGQLTPAQIEAAWQMLEFTPPVLAPGHDLVDVSLSGKHRTMICREATSRGMELPGLAAALLGRAADDMLFAALLDG